MTDSDLRDILSETRVIAVVGISNKTQRPSHEVAQYLQTKGYRIVPVNPGLAGRRCWANGYAIWARSGD